ncbi:YheC/YheD family protein [Paenibacillus sp.]|jgi:glutathione synthase/RimK-type ligase-like ATP-grasp enzyme|uniref:YheC/YheD family protein n=1 Tax=Paenibacillus sp. TaxID=58172 RepID=UPI0028333766|nr:YheC/YheD family protein [Paenibacillus sp.]MDR0270955.1 YheC/YheD family protein [Paenibacillus sp.]
MKNNQGSVASKLNKTQVLLHDQELAKHIPITRRFTHSQLFDMLGHYGMVYLKPDKGARGIGVMRVEKRGRVYCYQSGIQTFTFRTFQGMFHSLRNRIGGRQYLVQKGIHVLRHHGRPFDFRVMIQKNPSRQWEPTGTVARVAHPHKAVTNGSQGGTIYSAVNLMKAHAGKKKTAELLQKMNRIANLTADRIGREFPKLNEMGLDIAVDRNLTPWILEVNSRPDPCPFTKLDNKDAIKKIVAYAKGYGRNFCLECTKSKRAPKGFR